MYAIIENGGKQYRVRAGDVLHLERFSGSSGDSVVFDRVLSIEDTAEGRSVFGTPIVTGASVQAQILEQARADKVIVVKKKRRKNYRRRNGHRQEMTVVRIESVTESALESTTGSATGSATEAATA